MKINITPTKFNSYPEKGILIKGETPKDWLFALQTLGVNLELTPVFPIPSKVANKLYGCFFVLNKFEEKARQLNVSVYQSYHDFIYLPTFSKISPKISKEQAHTVFKEPHVFHPDFGWVLLNETVNWKAVLQIEAPRPVEIIKPSKTVYTPRVIKSFQLIGNEEIDIIKALGLKVTPPKKETLTSIEKAKLKLFKTLFSANKNNKGGYDIEGKGLLKWLYRKDTSHNGSNSTFKKGFEKLLYRNQKETDKLLSLFKSNPNLALSRAIPLDMLGTSRDSGQGVFSFLRNTEGGEKQFIKNSFTKLIQWIVGFIFIIFIIKTLGGLTTGTSVIFLRGLLKMVGFIFLVSLIIDFFKASSSRTNRVGGSVSLDAQRMDALKKEYEKMAENAVKNKDYKKAASIYIKLLKDSHKAATILEEGKFYEEAAIIHLNYNDNKELAAKAYENGRFYEKSIKLYKEINQNEKVGDLYKLIHNKIEANKHFQLVVDNYLKNAHYVKASLVYKNKIEDVAKAQEPLLKGWKEQNDGYHCLHNYFNNISNEKLLKTHIKNIYENETNSSNIENFLKVLKIEHDAYESLQEMTKSIAYQAVAKYIKQNPKIAFFLNNFNDNSMLDTDIHKFVRNEKNKK